MGDGASNMMMTVLGKDLTDELTEAEQAEWEASEKLPPAFDEDCPPMTEEQLLRFVRLDHTIPK